MKSTPLRAAVQIRPDQFDVLSAIERSVLWLSTVIVHYANRVRPNPSGTKGGGQIGLCDSGLRLGDDRRSSVGSFL